MKVQDQRDSEAGALKDFEVGGLRDLKSEDWWTGREYITLALIEEQEVASAREESELQMVSEAGLEMGLIESRMVEGMDNGSKHGLVGEDKGCKEEEEDKDDESEGVTRALRVGAMLDLFNRDYTIINRHREGGRLIDQGEMMIKNAAMVVDKRNEHRILRINGEGMIRAGIG